MNGSPAKLGTISGTAGHRSALKQVTLSGGKSGPFSDEYIEKDKKENPDAYTAEGILKKAKSETDAKVKSKDKKTKTLDKKVYIKKGGSMKHKMKDLKAGSKERYEEYERRGWKHDATTKGYKPSKANFTDISGAPGEFGMKETDKGFADYMTKHGDITSKADEKTAKIQAKSKKKMSEVTEDTDKALYKGLMKAQKDERGKDSMEYQQSKMAYLKSKEADRQGSGGGGKQLLFRGLSSWINKRKQAKTQKKIDEIAGRKSREKANEGKDSALAYGSPNKNMKTGKYTHKFAKKKKKK